MVLPNSFIATAALCGLKKALLPYSASPSLRALRIMTVLSSTRPGSLALSSTSSDSFNQELSWLDSGKRGSFASPFFVSACPVTPTLSIHQTSLFSINHWIAKMQNRGGWLFSGALLHIQQQRVASLCGYNLPLRHRYESLAVSSVFLRIRALARLYLSEVHIELELGIIASPF